MTKMVWKCVSQNVFPSHEIGDIKTSACLVDAFGKERHLCLLKQNERQKDSPNIRAEDRILGNTAKHPAPSTV
jgi:hypothetical protein